METSDVTKMTQAELVSIAGRCTELSCPYHGPYNRELRSRREDKWGDA